MKFEWEIVFNAEENHVGRLRVVGGWIVRSITYDSKTTLAICESMVFVPDTKHDWEIEKE